MDSIRSQETRYTTTAGAYAELGGGWDSNVNSGVGSPIITVPTLGTVQLAQSGVKSGNSFLHIGAGGQVSHPIAPGVALIGGASFEGKLHSDKFDSQFDQRSLAAYGGATYLKDKDLYRATLSVSQLSVDNRRFRDTVALGAEWHRQFDEFNTGSVFAQYARLAYPASPVRDADFYGFGVGWRRAFVGRIQPVFQVQALLGQEKNDFAPVRNDLTRDVATLRGSIAITPAPKWGASAGLTYTHSRFKAPDPLFAATRGDNYYGVEVGASYRVAKDLSLRADYLYSNNDSNIALYEYKRHAVTFRARYEF